MGCTSSAPTMVNPSTAEKSMQSEEEISDDQTKSKDTEQIIYRVGNVTDDNTINVLPSCDTLAEHNIFRNRPNPSLKTEKENQEDENIVKINKTGSSHKLQEEEHPTKLEEVVEKVVELHTSENINRTQTHSKRPDLPEEQSEKTQENNDSNNLKESNVLQDNEDHSDVEQDKQKVDHPEEAVSPTQSESSRATRWEALADIAAELPPSLTVDPLTGQIYTLSK